ncbi:formylglycine-generating enzyme family protein [Croceicoccus gelatinilyticus]|uniref:formylglycine-generating enzyme family protein n=1 Tax=Croceicoccus gelatinilyticus TaxID=2835536 RepID=UPI001BCDC7FF|nr:SUMF1/EgtB/PvdO family nonheme iron enzyme [Croceicoccus gelatinilyticus]MBS7669075.1 SUMF1/EgtB/PvdO family nonheme iron enzyme [Croceicoccus gelatinilyticus]
MSMFALGLLASVTGGLADGATFTECTDCPEMVVVPGGTFVMGADEGEEGRYEGPPHEVTIERRFAIGIDPVTVGQFSAFVADTGYEAASDCIVPMDGTYKVVPGADWRDPQLGRPPLPNEPVVCIDFTDATAYAAWVAAKTGKPYRLLSEAEWEYTARGGLMARFPWGDDPEDACDHGNFMDASAPSEANVEGDMLGCSDGYAQLAPVGRMPANAFGVREMVGNVWTWVQDCYEMPYPADTPTDGSAYLGGACDRHSVRGASWATNVTRARPTFRGRDPVDRTSSLFSVRLARDLP